MAKKSLEDVLKQYFAPEKAVVKGEPKIIIVVNGNVITERIKNNKALEKQLKAMAIEDARLGRSTDVLVYKLEGKANTSFNMDVNIDAPKEAKTEEGAA